MQLHSSAFQNNKKIPSRFAGTGDDISPPLEWSGVPRGCRSLALVCEDPDAPIKPGMDHPITHWVVYNVPPTVSALHENIAKKKIVEDVKGIQQGKNSLGKIGYSGPKPPPGDPAHRYIFTLYALDIENLEEPGAEQEQVKASMQGHILDSVQIIGKYQVPREGDTPEEETETTIPAIGFAAASSFSSLKPFEFARREPRENEVLIDILYCGVCHSDIHQVKNEWKNSLYPCMPGHEIVGRVNRTGSAVQTYRTGDIVGVGCMVDSCHRCPSCLEGMENYCEEGFLATYNGNSRSPSKEHNTFGGYSNTIVVREDFVLKIPENLDLASAAPIMCAGVTTYSPLKRAGVGPGKKVGIVGLGGLGHMAVKLAVAMGAEVTVITTSPEKISAARALGAKGVIVSGEKKEMKKHEKTLDFILSTIPEAHDANPYTKLLKRDGELVIVGCLVPLLIPLNMTEMIMDRRRLGSSLIGSIRETQEVLDFCGAHNVAPDIKLIDIDRINEVYGDIEKKHADFRYVIDMNSIKGKTGDESFFQKIGLQ